MTSIKTFMEDVKTKGPFILATLESAQAFLSQHPLEETEESTPDKGHHVIMLACGFICAIIV